MFVLNVMLCAYTRSNNTNAHTVVIVMSAASYKQSLAARMSQYAASNQHKQCAGLCVQLMLRCETAKCNGCVQTWSGGFLCSLDSCISRLGGSLLVALQALDTQYGHCMYGMHTYVWNVCVCMCRIYIYMELVCIHVSMTHIS